MCLVLQLTVTCCVLLSVTHTGGEGVDASPGAERIALIHAERRKRPPNHRELAVQQGRPARG